MLVAVRDDAWNMLNMQHISPNKIWDYSDIPPVVALEKIKGPKVTMHRLRHPTPTHPTTGARPAKNTANAAGALRNALTACNTPEGTKRFSGAVWISARNGQRTS